MQSSIKTRCIVFSKDRSAQLLALLESFRDMCTDFSSLDIQVLYKTSSIEYENQYGIIEDMFENVCFFKETDLVVDIHILLFEVDYVLFLVDDCVFVKPFCFLELVRLLEKEEDTIGVSLRLGRNINHCYPHDCYQKKPEFETISSSILKFSWVTSDYDFGYPLELSSSMYRMGDIWSIIDNNGFRTVNELEDLLYRNRTRFEENRPSLCCFTTSRAFCIPLNIVASMVVNKNRHSNQNEYSLRMLCNRFQSGWKIDLGRFYGMSPTGCHQEVELSWIKR